MADATKAQNPPDCKPTDPCDRYVYMLMREDGMTPFYIGKGRGRRINQHEKKSRRGFNKHKDAIIDGMQAKGLSVPKMKVACGLTNAQANNVEITLIAAYRRDPDGPLVNVLGGGEGGLDPTPELRAHFSRIRKGRRLTDEHKEKVRQAFIGRFVTSETREKMRIASTGRAHTSETRAKISAAKIGTKMPTRSAEYRAKISTANKAYWTAERRAEFSRSQTGRRHSPEAIQKMAAAARLREEKKRIARGVISRWQVAAFISIP